MRSVALLGVWAGVHLFGCSTSADPPASDAQTGGVGAGAGDSSSAGKSLGGAASAQGGANAGSAGAGGVTTTAGSGQAGSSQAGSAGTDACGGAKSTDGVNGPIQVTLCAAAPGDVPAQTAAALVAVNKLRAAMGIPCMTLVNEISVAAQKHCDYYQQNLDDDACTANAHAEVDGCPGFVAASFSQRLTLAGYTGSPRSEVMAFSGDAERAIAQWINSVYHRTPLISPWIRELGYGGTEDCDTIDMGAGEKTPDDVTAVYPYPNQVDVPRDFDGSHEGPTPPEPPSGWPSASPVHLYAKNFTVTSHDIFATNACAPLTHQWLPENDHYILYPDAPYDKQTTYRVVISGTRAGSPLTFDWTFETED